MEPLGKSVLGLITSKFKESLYPIVSAWPQFAYISHRSASDAIRRVTEHCNDTRQLLRNQQRNVHQRAANIPSFAICGGVQMFLDISRAFDVIPRQPLFDHLSTLAINQEFVSILGTWHSNTAYITNHEQIFVETPTGCGIRQGCRAAPVLWTGFTNLIFETLSTEIDAAWIRKALTIYADDIHGGAVFHSEWEFTQTLQKFGIILDVIERHGLTISLSKSMLLISFGGTNYRKLQARVVHRGDNGFFVNIPRADGRISKMPVHKTACYLGVQMSYTQTEKITLQHRMRAAKQAYFRLRRWLRARQLRIKTKLHLWHSCIYTTLIYGLSATNITFPGLFQLYPFILQQFRQITGNYSFQTGLTHSQFLLQYNLQHPFAMLMHSIDQMRRLQCQRLMHMGPQDILHTVDWSNFHCLEQLIHTAWNTQDQTMDQLLPNMHEEVHYRFFACEWCLQRFDNLPNLRRHQTHVHGFTQLRTQHIIPASFALNGLPICSNCHKTFSTWRRFRIHLERNCCQATTGTASSSMMSRFPDAPHRGLTSNDLSLLMSKPYGPTLLQAVKTGTWTPLRALAQAHVDLRNYCILCGVYHGRPQELNMHIRTQHAQYVANVFAKAAQLGRSQASITPCFYCNKQFLRQHQCPFWTQIALLLVNLPPGDAGDTDVVLRCEICRQQFEAISSLHAHLFTDHKLEVHDWLPNRDLLGADPVCSHCLACFAEKSAVRQHITRGLCPSFNAAKPMEELPVPPSLHQIILPGDLGLLQKSPMLRLSMTLHCQLCGVRFERQQDLSLHLQTVHVERWMQTQTTLHLLMQVGTLDTSCVCNPQTTARGVSHVCPAFRQLSMLAQKVDQELFLPWTFDMEGTRRFLSCVQSHAVIDTILTQLELRQFSDLWHNISVCKLLSTTCLICGGTYHPAVLCEHVKAMHFHSCTWIPDLLPQLLPEFLKHQTCDFQCKSCELVYNLPMQPDCTDEQLQQRQQLVQIHAQHHCPVVYQIGLLLTHGLPSRAGGHPHGGRRDSGSLQGDGPTPDAGQVPARHKRRKRSEKTQTGTSTGEPDRNHRRGQTGEAHGQHPTATGHRQSTDEKARLLRLLSSNSRTCLVAPLDVESEGMAHPDEAEDTGNGGAAAIHSSEDGPFSGPGDHDGGQSDQAVESWSRGRALADGAQSWSHHSGGQFSFSTMEPAAKDVGPNEEGSHHDEQDDQVHGAAQTDLHRSNCNSEIPCTETGRESANRPLDPPDRSPPRRTPVITGAVTGLDGMGIDWRRHETSHTSSEQAVSGTPTTIGEREGQTEREPVESQGTGQTDSSALMAPFTIHQLREGFEDAILINLENWCYANTAILTLLWALLSCCSYSNMEWGPYGPDIVRFLQLAQQNPVHLPDHSWFQRILASWYGEDEQCDPVEFLTHLVKGLRIPGIDWSWERRVQLGSDISVRDKSESSIPITLHLDPELSHAGWIRLDDLINTWFNYQGMQTALTGSSPLMEPLTGT